MNRKTTAREAIFKALKMRKQAGFGLDSAICVYDLAQRLDVEVRFLDLPSMEGMYYNAPRPHIIVSSMRPVGRRAFTCAHELGHHSFGDGVHMHELIEESNLTRVGSREFAADCFAGALLMPKMAIERAFAVRGWDIRECTPDQIFVISSYFGVGYTTLVYHLRTSLHLLPHFRAEKLLKVPPRKAQDLALGWETSKTVWIVDGNWKGRPIDVEEGDLIFVRGQACLEGRSVGHLVDKHGGRILRAGSPGISRLEDDSGWSAFIRVSRREYVGRGVFRHVEEVGNEQSHYCRRE